jgi:hypothetical protein
MEQQMLSIPSSDDGVDRERREAGAGWALRDGSIAGIPGKQLPALRPDDLLQTCVPFGCYEDVLVTEEFEKNKPGAFQLKFYASGVGNVRVGWRGRNEEEQETLVLVDVIRLDAADLEKIRAGALELDANGHRRAEGSWGRTPPAEQFER